MGLEVRVWYEGVDLDHDPDKYTFDKIYIHGPVVITPTDWGGLEITPVPVPTE